MRVLKTDHLICTKQTENGDCLKNYEKLVHLTLSTEHYDNTILCYGNKYVLSQSRKW